MTKKAGAIFFWLAFGAYFHIPVERDINFFFNFF